MRNEDGIRGLVRRFQAMMRKAAPFAHAEGRDLRLPFLLTLDLKRTFMTNTLLQLSALIEAFLFAKGSPVSLTDMAKAVGEDSQMIEKALTLLSEKYEKPDSGLTLHHTGAGYMLATKKKYDTWLSSLLGKQTPLSAAALETLAVVACKEPVTRVEIEKIRGVTAGRVLGLLMEKGLIEERGRLDIPGRPILYGTTKRFLACTGLSDVNELRMRWREGLEEGELF